MAALDTREKRMAAVGVGRPFMRAVNAGNLGATQRPSIGIGYAFDFAPFVPPDSGLPILAPHVLEIGKMIRVGLGVMALENTGLELILEPEVGIELTLTEDDGVTLGTVDATEGDQVLKAYTYVEYQTKKDDLKYAGQWRKQGRVSFDNGSYFAGDFVRFTVLS
ncbi:MAG: hypothetical protein DRR42_19680 [Gammaproteobacteria bacterium]|nr:MAG: hypothetical protein DRR42_19680 [Gammaproteobacteria bacterium]